MTILVVEDDDAVRSGISRFLSAAGYRVIHAATGNDAFELAVKIGPALSLAVIDLRLPDMIGDELWRKLNHQLLGIRTLFISGHPIRALPVLPVHRQEVTFLAKPFDLSELDRAVKDLLATR